MNENENKIKQELSRWYCSVCIGCTNEILSLRLNGIYAYVDDSKNVDIFSLVKMCFGFNFQNLEENPFVIAIFNEDKTFNLENKRELSCLAAMTLMYLLESNNVNFPQEEQDKIILSVLCLNEAVTTIVLPEFVSYIKSKMDKTTAQYREKKHGKFEYFSEISKEEYNSIEDGAYNSWNEDTKDLIIQFFKQHEENIITIMQNQYLLMNSIMISQEDSDILAWIIGGYSNDLKIHLSKSINSKEVALILGKELSDLVLLPLGPFASKGYLKKMLDLCKLDNKKYNIIDIVNYTDREWRKELLSHIDGLDICTPILFAIKQSIDVEDGSDWSPICASKYKGWIDKTYNIIDWAYFFYLECLLIKLS